MSALHIHLFGKFSVECDDRAVNSFNANKVQELFSYLLVYRNRPHSRESLAGLLWGESDTDKSKKYLRQTLWHLQTALESQCLSGAKILNIEHDWVELRLNDATWLDVDVCERAFALVQKCSGRELEPETAGILHAAVESYKGDLLEGWYKDWCLYERERLQNTYLMILDKLLVYCTAQSHYSAGQHYGSLILRCDRAHERTHRRLMLLHYEAGDRTGALRQYERCTAALDEELGVAPDKSTVALYQKIRAARSGEQVSLIDEGETTAHTSVSSPDVLRHLRRLQSYLLDVQKQIQNDIKAVEEGVSRRQD